MNALDRLFDRILVLNLPASAQRRAFIKRQFEELGLQNWEFLPGVDGGELDIPALVAAGEVVLETPIGNTLQPGEVGCGMSHRKAWETALERGYKTVLICEDDVLWNKDVSSWVDAHWRDVPGDWAIVHFHYYNRGKVRRQVTPNVAVGEKEHSGAVAYALTRPGLEWLVKAYRPINKAADGMTGWVTTERCPLNGYVLTPRQARTKETLGSDINRRGSRRRG